MQDPKLEDKVIDALRDLAGAVGETAEQLWPAAVKATWAEGLTSVLVGVILAAVATTAGRIVFCMMAASQDADVRGDRYIPMVLATIASAVALSVGVGSGLPELLAPEGETLFRLFGQ